MSESIAGSAAMMKERANPFPLKINVKCSAGMCGSRAGIYTLPIVMTGFQVQLLLGLDSDTFYIYHVAAVMVDNLRRLLLGINLSDKAIMDFDFPGVGFPV